VLVLGTVTILSAATAMALPHGTAVIRTPGSPTVANRVEIAQQQAELQRGLSGRAELAPNAGMAFLFPGEVRTQFWMKDTSIPLSIAFWNRRGRILRILDMAPCLRDPCRVYDPGVRFHGALEVNRGAFVRWRTHPGSTIRIRR